MFFKLLLSAHFLPPLATSLLSYCPLSFPSEEWTWPLLLSFPHSTNSGLFWGLTIMAALMKRKQTKMECHTRTIGISCQSTFSSGFHVPGILTSHCELSLIRRASEFQAGKQMFSVTLLCRAPPGPLGLTSSPTTTTTKGPLMWVSTLGSTPDNTKNHQKLWNSHFSCTSPRSHVWSEIWLCK